MSDQYLTSNNNSTNVLFKAVGWLLLGFWQIAPAATGRMIMRLFFRPRSLRQRPKEKAVWDSGTPFTLQLHGRTLHGRYWGDGPGVLFVHGWNGRGSQCHQMVDSIVAAGYRAITFDGPAHGDSDGSFTTYFEFTDVVRAFLRGEANMSVDKVIAHSFGSGAVINALHKEKRSLDVVLVAPALMLEEYLHQSFQQYGIPFRLFDNLIKWLEQDYGYLLRRDNPRRLLKKLRAPLLLIHDQGDKIIPHTVSKQFVEQQPHIVLKTTQGLGHTKILQSSEAIDLIMAYLTKAKPESVLEASSHVA